MSLFILVELSDVNVTYLYVNDDVCLMSMESEDRSLKIIMLISFIGLIDAIYLSYLHHLISQGAGCPTENLPGLDCGVVLASDQAKLFGIPVAWLGVVGQPAP